MKKLQLLLMTVLALGALHINCAKESVDQRLDRQGKRTIEEKIDYLQEKIDSGKRLESPEFRLVLKAYEYRKDQEEGRMSLEQFDKQMAKKEKTFKENLERVDRTYNHHAERFFHICKTDSSKELARKMAHMERHEQKYLAQEEVLRIIERLKTYN